MQDQEPPRHDSIEKALMQELRFGGIDKENLAELVGIVAGLQKAGLKSLKAFPKGTPVPDSLQVAGIMDAGALPAFINAILTKTPRLSGIYFFPYGTPWPDIFRVRIGLGASRASPDPDGDPAIR